MAARPNKKGQKTQRAGARGHLLILACSQRKNEDRSPAPAMDLYEGPAYRVLRKALVERGWPPKLRIKILSAKHGLIDATTLIEPYNERLNAAGAAAKNKETLRKLHKVTKPRGPTAVFLDLGRDYLPAVEGVEGLFPDATITYAEGPIGARASQLKTWLVGECPEANPVPFEGRPASVVFRGVELTNSPREIIGIAEQKRRSDPRAASFHTWYVQIGEHRVAPKWLLSVLTGVPVAAFRTADAVRVLTRLGLGVCSV